MFIESVMPSNHLILCRPLLLLPSIFSSIRIFTNESALCIRGSKYWSFSFKISPTNEHPGLISFRKDWLDLLAVQGTLKSLLQCHSLKAAVQTITLGAAENSQGEPVGSKEKQTSHRALKILLKTLSRNNLKLIAKIVQDIL